MPEEPNNASSPDSASNPGDTKATVTLETRSQIEANTYVGGTETASHPLAGELGNEASPITGDVRGPGIRILAPRARPTARRRAAARTIAAAQRVIIEGLRLHSVGDSDFQVSYAESLVTEARCLGGIRALNLILATPPKTLLTRVWAADFLFEGDHGWAPLLGRGELAVEIEKFATFLQEESFSLVEWGLPRHTRCSHPWLLQRNGRLYPLKNSRDVFLNLQPGMELDLSRGWLRIEGSGIETNFVQVDFERADYISGIDVPGCRTLVEIRPKLLECKLKTFALMADCLRNGEASGLWSGCFSIIREKLTDVEVAACLSMDEIYRVPPVTQHVEGGAENQVLDPAVASAFGVRGGLQPGGLTNLIQTIGYVAKELSVGTMHRAASAVSEAHLGRPQSLFCPRSSTEKVALRILLDEFIANTELEFRFWREFNERAKTDLDTNLDIESQMSFRIRPQDSQQFTTLMAAYAAHVKVSLEALGTVISPATPLKGECATNTLPDNVFRKAGNNFWELQFGDGKRSLIAATVGLSHLYELIQKQGQEITVANLQAASALSRTVRTATPRSSTLPVGMQAPSSLGDVSDKRALKSYSDRLSEIDSDLDRARANCDASEVDRLTTQREDIRSVIRSSLDLYGRQVQMGNSHKKMRNAIKRAIERTFDAIDLFDEPMAVHFRQSVRFGISFSYHPSPRVEWHLGITQLDHRP